MYPQEIAEWYLQVYLNYLTRCPINKMSCPIYIPMKFPWNSYVSTRGQSTKKVDRQIQQCRSEHQLHAFRFVPRRLFFRGHSFSKIWGKSTINGR